VILQAGSSSSIIRWQAAAAVDISLRYIACETFLILQGKHGSSFPWAFLPLGEEAWLGCLHTASNSSMVQSPRVN